MTGPARSAKPDRLFVPNKDSAYVYHWMNAQAGPQGDQNLYMAQYEGWEPAPMDGKVPTEVLSAVGQSTSQSGAGTTHRRGDLVLYRMPREQWEKTVKAETDEALQRQATTLDTMVMQANENAARQLKDRGQTRIPSALVFREDVGDPN